MTTHFGFGAIGAIVASASAADAQDRTIASTRVEASGHVRVVDEEPDRLLISTGGMIFALSAHADGRVKLTVADASRSGRAPAARDASGAPDLLTSVGREVVSLSVGGGENVTPGSSEGGDVQVRVVIANYN
jgi:hypothetical protein